MYSQNGAAFLFPLHYHARGLRERGVALTFTTDAAVAGRDWDVLCVSSRFFMSWWSERGTSSVTSFLGCIRSRVSRIIWFDITDSTGTAQFAVLPYVDRYCKGQVLRDRMRYRQQYIGARVFTDYYARSFDVRETPDEEHLNLIPSIADLEKVTASWHSGLAHYGLFGPQLHRFWYHAGGAVPRWYPHEWTSPGTPRSIFLSCRIGTHHHRRSVAHSRSELSKRLAWYLRTDKVSRREFFSEMQRARAVVSPFGLGEITLRDFEAIICGAATLKQDMAHVETWPNLWIPEETYIPFAWDFSDLDERVATVLHDPVRMVGVATRAQEAYRRALCSPEGHAEFCERFVNLATWQAPFVSSTTGVREAAPSRASLHS